MYLTNQTIKKVAHFDLKKEKKYAFSKGKRLFGKYIFQFLNNITYIFTYFYSYTVFKKIKNYYLNIYQIIF